MPPAQIGEEADDAAIIRALRSGDEAAFARLVGRHHATLIRIATLYVSDYAAAEEVAQETWLAVLGGLEGFEERSSFKTWMFRILTNRARTRGKRDKRTIPFAALVRAEIADDEPAVDPSRFQPEGGRSPGHWISFPRDWDAPEERVLAQETQTYLRVAIGALPPAQRAVLTLHDVEGMGAREVCNILAISATNQRVLLHRARAQVRQALAPYMEKA
jgi:RNA polymerase sigma-70 factor (ECF subfamily)